MRAGRASFGELLLPVRVVCAASPSAWDTRLSTKIWMWSCSLQQITPGRGGCCRVTPRAVEELLFQSSAASLSAT